MKKIQQFGKMDYDEENDLLFFSLTRSEYLHSLELHDIIVDLDKENKIMGIEMFNAAKLLNVSPNSIIDTIQCMINIIVHKGKLQIHFFFKIEHHGEIIQKEQVITQVISSSIPDVKTDFLIEKKVLV